MITRRLLTLKTFSVMPTHFMNICAKFFIVIPADMVTNLAVSVWSESSHYA